MVLRFEALPMLGNFLNVALEKVLTHTCWELIEIQCNISVHAEFLEHVIDLKMLQVLLSSNCLAYGCVCQDSLDWCKQVQSLKLWKGLERIHVGAEGDALIGKKLVGL